VAASAASFEQTSFRRLRIIEHLRQQGRARRCSCDRERRPAVSCLAYFAKIRFTIATNSTRAFIPPTQPAHAPAIQVIANLDRPAKPQELRFYVHSLAEARSQRRSMGFLL
jgi:hypothetical protein